MSSVSFRNILINQGSDSQVVIEMIDTNGEPLNLTNYTAESKIRKHYLANTSFDFTCQISDINIITLSLTSAESAAIPAGRYVYDLNIVSNSDIVTRVAEGICTIAPSVTHE